MKYLFIVFTVKIYVYFIDVFGINFNCRRKKVWPGFSSLYSRRNDKQGDSSYVVCAFVYFKGWASAFLYMSCVNWSNSKFSKICSRYVAR